MAKILKAQKHLVAKLCRENYSLLWVLFKPIYDCADFNLISFLFVRCCPINHLEMQGPFDEPTQKHIQTNVRNVGTQFASSSSEVKIQSNAPLRQTFFLKHTSITILLLIFYIF